MPTDPDTPRLGAAALLARGLTPGKLRGLRRIAHPDGTLALAGLDDGHDADPGRLLTLAATRAEAASAVALGPSAAWSASACGAVPARRGLVVRVDAPAEPGHPDGVPRSAMAPAWSAAKVKRMGADAALLRLPFDPDAHDAAEHQLALLSRLAEDCRRLDLLLVVAASPADPADADRRAAVVIETARLLGGLADVYAADFPGTFDVEDVDQLHDNLLALGEASPRPWLLATTATNPAECVEQVEMAMECGASGFLAGPGFHAGTAADAPSRLAEAAAVAVDRAVPWFVRHGLTAEDLLAIRPAPDWPTRYDDPMR